MLQTDTLSPREQLKKLVLTGLFAGASAAVGYLFMVIPNIEGFTAMIFAGGFILGSSYGIISAMIASLLYFGLNPQGGLFPPLLIAQMIGMISVALTGHLYFLKFKSQRKHSIILLAICGFALTLWYDVLTNIAYPLSIGAGISTIFAFLIAGIPFSVLHIVSNICIFMFLIPPIIDLSQRLSPRLDR